MKACLMRRFSVDDNYVIKEWKVRDLCHVFLFYFYVVETGARKELDNGARLEDALKIPK